VGTPEGQRRLATRTRRSENNIKIDLTEIKWDNVVWINVAEDKHEADVCEDLIEPSAKNSLASWGTSSLSRKALLQAVSWLVRFYFSIHYKVLSYILQQPALNILELCYSRRFTKHGFRCYRRQCGDDNIVRCYAGTLANFVTFATRSPIWQNITSSFVLYYLSFPIHCSN
jgi:hypothetical protein